MRDIQPKADFKNALKHADKAMVQATNEGAKNNWKEISPN